MRPLDRAEYLGYTPATESRRLIEHGLPKQLPETLGGRHRFTPLSLYVGDRVATAAFARLDGVGSFWLDIWLLSHRRGRWHLRTGSCEAAAPGGEDVLAPRPYASVLNGHARTGTSARYNLSAVRWLPWPWRWVIYGIVRLSAEVGTIRYADREIAVPEHGLQALAWPPSRDGLTLALLDHKGQPLSHLRLP